MKHQYKVRKNRIKYVVITLCFLLVSLGYSMNLYADQLMVEERVLVNAPAKTVWALIGGFQVLDRWHPAVLATTLLGTGKDTGDIRVLALGDDVHIVEKLELYDETEMSFQYSILESPLPLENYHAVITVKSAADNEAEVIWQSTFNAVGASNDEVKKTISDIYLAGLNALITLYK
ncbi:MAG: SRPBCC family protein [Gammaproteobacteria bacterium]|nr:MAG: SRPBCC family protein [Gammaproteobacteria bacterium]